VKAKLLVAALFILVCSDLASGFDFQTCGYCHSRLQDDSQKQIIHSPFGEGTCEECHVNATVILTPEKQKIEWLNEDPIPLKAHHFKVKGDELGEILVVDMISSSGSSKREEIPVPSLHEIKQIEKVETAPTILNPRLISLKQGIFLTATVGWKTDILADATVRYGEEDLSQETSENKRFGQEHFVVIRNLAPNRSYQFVAISNDGYGRKSESSPVMFSTSIDTNQSQSEITEFTEVAETVAAHFSRVGDEYLITVQLDQENQIFLGTKGRKKPCLPEDEFHSGLNCVEDILMAPCVNCHVKHDHPVGVVPMKDGIRIPERFPTMPSGEIACASCHSPHSSQHYNLTRMDSREKLCAHCHIKWNR